MNLLGHAVESLLRLVGCGEVLRTHCLLLTVALGKIVHIQLRLSADGRVVCQHGHSGLIHELIKLGLVKDLDGRILGVITLCDTSSK